jgi:hypothetical protein
LPWIRCLRPIAVSSLLFSVVGPPLGAVIYLAIAGIAAGKPWMMLEAFKDFGAVLVLAALFGAIPASITGVVAGILRIYIRSLLVLACLAAPVGAAVSVLYVFAVFFRLRDASPLIEWIGLTGGIAAFCCTFLLRRNRPWPIPAA